MFYEHTDAHLSAQFKLGAKLKKKKKDFCNQFWKEF